MGSKYVSYQTFDRCYTVLHFRFSVQSYEKQNYKERSGYYY